MVTDASKPTVQDVVGALWGNVYSLTGTATLDLGPARRTRRTTEAQSKRLWRQPEFNRRRHGPLARRGRLDVIADEARQGA